MYHLQARSCYEMMMEICSTILYDPVASFETSSSKYFQHYSTSIDYNVHISLLQYQPLWRVYIVHLKFWNALGFVTTHHFLKQERALLAKFLCQLVNQFLITRK